MSFFNDMENAVKKNGENGLYHLLQYYGVDLELYRSAIGDVYGRVHGRQSGDEGSLIDTFTGVIEGAEFSPSNESYSSDHVLGILYTEYKDLKAGDTIKIVSEDNKTRRFKVTEKRNIGFTTEIFTMWGVSSIGD